jgi:hypothetical protein
MKLEHTIAKGFKFVTFVFFTFTTLVYIGVLLLVPLDVLFQLIRLFHAVGFPTIISGCMGVALVGYLGLEVSRMPQLLELIVDIGRQLVEFGHSQIRRCDALIQTPAERAS